MLDGVLFEAKGIPAAVVCTTPFRSSAKTMAMTQRMPDFCTLYIPHPIAITAEPVLTQWAEDIYPAVKEWLLQGTLR